MDDPFLVPQDAKINAKFLLYGDFGTGKTTLALQFPSPCLIDMEKGADLYSKKYKFKVLKTNSCKKVTETVQWLMKNKNPYRTLIIDPITEFWSSLQDEWTDRLLRLNKESRGYKDEYYELQPKDWMNIKRDFKEFMRNLISLDMNIICICRQKDLYSEEKMLKKIGKTFDGDRSLPFYFDTVLHLTNGAKYLASVEKDRTGRLPKQFEVDYSVIAKAFGFNEAASAPPESVTAGMQEHPEYKEKTVKKTNGSTVKVTDEEIKPFLENQSWLAEALPFSLTYYTKGLETKGHLAWRELPKVEGVKKADGQILGYRAWLHICANYKNQTHPDFHLKCAAACKIFKEQEEFLKELSEAGGITGIPIGEAEKAKKVAEKFEQAMDKQQ